MQLVVRGKPYIYVGMTTDLDRRLKEHNDGKSRTTRPYRPFKLIHTEVFSTRLEARAREKQLKSGYGKEFLKQLE
jgi:putative endonuclease